MPNLYFILRRPTRQDARSSRHHPSQFPTKKPGAQRPRPHAPATEAIQRGANLKRPQPHAVAPALTRQPTGKADVLWRNSLQSRQRRNAGGVKERVAGRQSNNSQCLQGDKLIGLALLPTPAPGSVSNSSSSIPWGNFPHSPHGVPRGVGENFISIIFVTLRKCHFTAANLNRANRVPLRPCPCSFTCNVLHIRVGGFIALNFQ